MDIQLPDAEATAMLGEDLARALVTGDCLALSGDLGAGKTTLSRALIRALAEAPDLEVPSPTFTLVQTYDSRIPVAHFDLYRLADGSELEELGFDEALSEGICLVEWPDRASAELPVSRITLTLTHEGQGRLARFSGPQSALDRIGRSLDIRAFLDRAGWPKATRRFLTGDASVRAYERILRRGDADLILPDLILMDAPRRPRGAVVRDGKTYPELAHIAEDVTPFVAIDHWLRDAGFTAPAILAQDLEAGLLLLEDLGREGVIDASAQPIAERYLASAALLARLHRLQPPRDLPVAPGLVHTVPDFDRTAMAIETSLLIDWYLPEVRGTPATEAERADYEAIWNGLIDRLADGERHLLLRDFHSPNILWQAEREDVARVGLIDFQDAMIGPTAYDLAALAQDARVTIPPALRAEMIETYLAARGQDAGFDRERFLRDFHLMAAQRNCKLVGIWVRLKVRDGKPGYMQHMPRTMAYLREALAHPALEPLADWCRKAGLPLSDEKA
ncbi:tRNA (adenosine(37)-N6)-threonylcarbamoyltransferase complex ATPase subunit type 1 TsaE [Rhizobium rhizosphaerae]|uniref:tRNA threonylcarbamoyladenosine biosynthesis protein TsaE n=1 Tax=Xaviernesmea rhizosphaerae TaxID=1672749 RepID=A0A1Q9AGE2_9HYPH|nr:tRNA (adenosine(37)-N6)-threonylcarbamoyltransferase complex ATPase subunit type 1 TsaE [Xaviernesmea rhizosphaerae]OLP54040.1 tRNA (adenosine(37)-N6)-threonylcarbamoyltransferase complex ATPase subunit type 1 TsaE [Xaviernesmea rhizosphaerae]